MDYNMVNMNGDETTREVIIYKKIKRLISHEGYVDCYIVGHSSDYSQEIQDSFKNAQADQFERKPATVDRLKGII